MNTRSDVKTPAKPPSSRSKADTELVRSATSYPAVPTDDDPQKLLHELRVYQIELEIQNEELRRVQAELQSSLARYVDLYEFSPAGYLTLNQQGMIVEINVPGTRLLGMEHEQLLQQRFERFIAAEDCDRWRLFFDNALQQAVSPHDIELTIQRGNVNFYARLDCLRTIEQIPGDATIRIMLSDVTERKRMEHLLRQESDKNRVFLRNASDGIGILDYEGYLVEVSDSFCSMLGYTREEIIGMHVSQWEERGDAYDLMGTYRQQFEQKDRGQFETRHCRKDGSSYEAEVSSLPVELDGKLFLLTSTRDITERKALERQVAEMMREVEDLYNRAPCGYHSLDRDGVILNINDTQLEWMERSRDEVIGKKMVDFFMPESQERFWRMYAVFLNIGHIQNQEFELRAKSGNLRQVSISATAIVDAEGNFLKSRSVVYDITALKTVEWKLKLLTLEQQAMLDSDLIAIAKIRDGKIIWHNKTLEYMFGYETGELTGVEKRILYPTDRIYEVLAEVSSPVLSAQGIYRTQQEMRRKDGQTIWVALSGTLLPGAEQDSIWMLADVTLEHEYYDKIQHIAYHDFLTGLPNRLLISDRLTQMLSQADRSHHVLAVCYLDLDGFKPVNDDHGHAVGDQLLVEIARRMTQAVRPYDSVGRLGGDEFVLILSDLETAEEYRLVVQRVLNAINQPVLLDNATAVTVGASIGVALFPDDGMEADQLLRQADQAMYRAKQLGRNRICSCH